MTATFLARHRRLTIMWWSRLNAFLGMIILLSIFSGCGESAAPAPAADTTPPADQSPGPGLGTVSLTDRDIQFLPAKGFALGPIRLTPVATHSTHVLILGNLQSTPAQVTLKGPTSASPAKQLATTAAGSDDAEGLGDDPLHKLLRAAEINLALSQEPLPLPIKAETIHTCPALQTFRVLASLSSLQLTTEVTAAKVRESATSCTYIDPAAGLDPKMLESTLDEFDTRMIPKEHALFGTESDINGDGKITLLFTPAVNRLGTFAGGIISGFFFAGDLFPRSATNASSNGQEILYLSVPDPAGAFGPRLDRDFTLKTIIPAVLAHELQHMINFAEHSARGGKKVEEAWLNESLSHLTEDLLGHGTDNFSRVSLCLQSINLVPLIPLGPPNLAERGCDYLFLRFIYEQADEGDPFLSRLVQSDKSGIANILQAISKTRTDFDQFSEIWARWQVAVTFSGTSAIDDARFIFRPLSTDTVTRLPTGTCLRCTPDDGRHTELHGPATLEISSYPATLVLAPLATQVLVLTNPPANLDLDASANVSLVGSLTPLN